MKVAGISSILRKKHNCMVEIIKNRKWSFALSGILVGLSFLALVVWGLKPGIDFTGGSLVEVEFAQNRPEITAVQEALGTTFGDVLVQTSGDKQYIFKLKFLSPEEHQNLLGILQTTFGQGENVMTENRTETIGPAVSEVLKRRSASAGVVVVIAIIAFIAYSFRKVADPVASWKFGVVAVITLIHDVGIAMGIFAVLGHYLDVRVDIAFVVAMLTIFGYSVNDTIVVFDRIREKLIRRTGGQTFANLTNKAVNETLWRSFNTSFTVLLSLTALYFLGGESTRYFTLALLIGILFGTYSSIFLASPLLVAWQEWDSR